MGKTNLREILDGIYSAIEHVNEFEIINLGESQTINVSQLINEIEQALGKTAIRNILPMQPGDVIKTYADISKAKRLLDYNPNINIETGIKQFIKWYREQKS